MPQLGWYLLDTRSSNIGLNLVEYRRKSPLGSSHTPSAVISIGLGEALNRTETSYDHVVNPRRIQYSILRTRLSILAECIEPCLKIILRVARADLLAAQRLDPRSQIPGIALLGFCQGLAQCQVPVIWDSVFAENFALCVVGCTYRIGVVEHVA